MTTAIEEAPRLSEEFRQSIMTLSAAEEQETDPEGGIFDKSMCLKCGNHPHAIELCHDCEQKFIAVADALRPSNGLLN